MIKKILIANRGEIALRVIRTCRELGIKSVAVFSTADQDSLHVKFADEAVCIGPPSGADSYLNIPNIIAAVEVTNADAIHPGYGFLSENVDFAEICKAHKINFIGPDPMSIVKMGDKATAIDTMKKAKVPTVPGSEGIVHQLEEAEQIAHSLGFPVMIKATAGGGGKGMRMIKSQSSFKKSWEEAKREAKAAFGNDGLYIEKFIEQPRHIEIQVLGDKHGNVIHLSERECSIQRRHQKLIEETPSPFIDDKLREEMGQAAIKAARSINYVGAGTVEFLVDKNKNFYFMEMNTRLQVEHPITEQVTGVDLVEQQIRIAEGKKINNENYYPKGHSIECRINAEDPSRNFIPSPGLIDNLHLPGGLGVRNDTHVYSGYKISPYYDSMVGKLIVTAETRQEAINKMKRSLSEMTLQGIKTTIPLHLDILNHPDFVKGKFDTGFLENKIQK